MDYEKFLKKKNGAIIDWNQIAIEINAFFRCAGSKLASKIPNLLRPSEVFIETW